MKKNIESYDQLLKTLAAEADPSAFFSLGASCFKLRYQKEINRGTTHQDAKNRVISEAVELFRSLQKTPKKQLGLWFDDNFTLPDTDDNQEVLLEKKTAVETNSFLNECSLVLAREGSILRNGYHLKSRNFPYTIIKQKAFKYCMIPFSSIMVLFLLFKLMDQLAISVKISFSSPETSSSFQIPPRWISSEDKNIPGDSLNGKIATTSISSSETLLDSTNNDTISVNETTKQRIVEPLPPKKKYIPRPAPVSEPITEKRSPQPVITTPDPLPVQNTPSPPVQPVRTEELNSISPESSEPSTTPPAGINYSSESENTGF